MNARIGPLWIFVGWCHSETGTGWQGQWGKALSMLSPMESISNISRRKEACLATNPRALSGRLDFPPNEHALDYFLNKVWPQVKIRVPTAQFHICGVSPSSKLRSLMAGSVGVTFHEDADDLRPIIGKCRLAVFPMVSGAGVKNKVLEAAAMEKAIVATNCLP